MSQPPRRPLESLESTLAAGVGQPERDDAPPRSGHIITGGRGQYVLERELGSGAMGVVFKGHSVDQNRGVALKFLRPHILDREDIVERFRREAVATARLRSEHVVRVIDSGVHRSRVPFLAMDFVEGTDLRSWVGAHGPLSLDASFECVVHTSAALAEAHALGIVHRDLKPANLMRSTSPSGRTVVKVVDFGIAKFASQNVIGKSPALTGDGLLGSFNYMSPEQIREPSAVDARTDVWSLGATLYFLLSGKAPFARETMMDTLQALLTEPPAPLAGTRPDLTPAVDAVLSRCLERDREQRFFRITDVARELFMALPFTGSSEPGGKVTTRLP